MRGFAVSAILTGAFASVKYGGPERTAGNYLVHKHSKEHQRLAAWQRTTCGSVSADHTPLAFKL